MKNNSFSNVNMLTFWFIKFWYYGSLFPPWKIPSFLHMTYSITWISKKFVTILFPARKTWHFNYLASKRSYSFKKIILMRRWHCILYKFFLLFILNILNHWWRQCTQANEWNILCSFIRFCSQINQYHLLLGSYFCQQW